MSNLYTDETHTLSSTVVNEARFDLIEFIYCSIRTLTLTAGLEYIME